VLSSPLLEIGFVPLKTGYYIESSFTTNHQHGEPNQLGAAPRSHTRKNVLLGVPPNFYLPFSSRGYERALPSDVLSNLSIEIPLPTVSSLKS
jgi:hypothetical protein